MANRFNDMSASDQEKVLAGLENLLRTEGVEGIRRAVYRGDAPTRLKRLQAAAPARPHADAREAVPEPPKLSERARRRREVA